MNNIQEVPSLNQVAHTTGWFEVALNDSRRNCISILINGQILGFAGEGCISSAAIVHSPFGSGTKAPRKRPLTQIGVICASVDVAAMQHAETASL